MRHRIKKIPTLSKLDHKFNHHLLHSDKSTYTYFYKGKVKVSSLVEHILYSPSIPLLGGAALLLVLGSAINPYSSNANPAYAVTTEDLGNGASISLSILNNNTDVANDGEVSTNVNVGQMSYIDNIVRVNTTKIGRYYVGVQAAEGSSNELTNESGATIGVVGDNKGVDDFGDDTWGYVLTSDTAASNDALKYNTLPTYNVANAMQYQSPDNPADGNHDLKLTFAAKIRADKPGGHYRTKAMVSVAAEAKAIVTLGSITYMQDVTPEICAATPEADTGGNNQYRLKDSRDNKYYWVAKLKDNNCWMTQNLDLDLDSVTLKAADSDVGSDWLSTTGASKIWLGTSSNCNTIKYFDPGTYVYTTPTVENQCNGTTNGLSDCTGKGWLDVGGMTASSDPKFGTEVIDNTYNAHYLAGNYYSWAAATAGQGATITSTEATDYPAETTQSICPKGWTLPKSGKNTEDVLINTDGTFAKLFESYNWTWNLPADTTNKTYTDNLTGGTFYDLRVAPFYFLSGGLVNGARLDLVGGRGYYSSSAARSATSFYYLRFASGVTPSADGMRYDGLSVRCVAR